MQKPWQPADLAAFLMSQEPPAADIGPSSLWYLVGLRIAHTGLPLYRYVVGCQDPWTRPGRRLVATAALATLEETSRPGPLDTAFCKCQTDSPKAYTALSMSMP